MHKKIVFFFLFLMCSLQIWAASSRPNIILYMADDFGLASINALGADEKFVKTPNLNALAENGMVMQQAFSSASVCSPTRYAMLTGEYSWRTHLQSGVVNNNDPLLISTDKMTVGTFLQHQGYVTAAIGKWHLGYKSKTFKNLLGTIKPGPLDIGFHYHFGVPNNLDDLHKVYIENDAIYGLRSNQIQAWGNSFYGGKPYKGYDAPQRVTEDVMSVTTTKAMEWIKRHDKEQPFFLYYGAAAVHHPIKPSHKNKGTSGAGLYGDFIHDVDDSVGNFIELLKERDQLDNTIFIFTSDNGGDIPKAKTHQDWPEYLAYEMGFHFNGEHRGDKHTIYEGGLKVPFIVHWPNTCEPNSKSRAMVSTIDIFSTLADITTGTLPDPKKAAPDSFSFYPILKNSSRPSQRPFLIHRDAPGRQALRVGPWKLIHNIYPNNHGKPFKHRGQKELYHLNRDPMELNNLYASMPEKVNEMEKIYLEAKTAKQTRRTW